MTAFAGAASPSSRRSARLKLATPLVLGVAVAAIGVLGATHLPRAWGDLVVARAGDPAQDVIPTAPGQAPTTTASEQYRAWFTQRQGDHARTTGGDQYRAWYTGNR
jgi:hypothetical protein